MARLAFALELLRLRLSGQKQLCPWCGSHDVGMIDHKYLLLEAWHCGNCGLTFRYPQPDPTRSAAYYQEKYAHSHGASTEMPDDATLAKRKAELFKAPEPGKPSEPGVDYARWIAQLKPFVASGRVFEFGCSWGYGLYQLQRAGFAPEGYEISLPRAAYGREKLGIAIHTDIESMRSLKGSFDAVLTAHVLEHLPDLRGSLTLLRDLLQPNGLICAVVPNCGGAEARRLGLRMGGYLSEDHVLALDAPFLARALGEIGFSVIGCDSSPYRSLKPADAVFDGEELLVVAQRN